MALSICPGTPLSRLSALASERCHHCSAPQSPAEERCHHCHVPQPHIARDVTTASSLILRWWEMSTPPSPSAPLSDRYNHCLSTILSWQPHLAMDVVTASSPILSWREMSPPPRPLAPPSQRRHHCLVPHSQLARDVPTVRHSAHLARDVTTASSPILSWREMSSFPAPQH